MEDRANNVPAWSSARVSQPQYWHSFRIVAMPLPSAVRIAGAVCLCVSTTGQTDSPPSGLTQQRRRNGSPCGKEQRVLWCALRSLSAMPGNLSSLPTLLIASMVARESSMADPSHPRIPRKDPAACPRLASRRSEHRRNLLDFDRLPRPVRHRKEAFRARGGPPPMCEAPRTRDAAAAEDAVVSSRPPNRLVCEPRAMNHEPRRRR